MSPKKPKVVKHSVAARISKVFRGLLLLVLFLSGLLPLIIWAFQTAILRNHVDPNPWLIALGTLVSVIVANVADDQIGKSAKDVAGAAREILRLRRGNTHEHKAKEGDLS